VSEVRDLNGRLLARWLLLTNVPAGLADAATVALWYYFRWRTESMYKLMKSAGWQLESWLQHDGRRILTKLMVAFGACASIWALERKRDAESEGFKQLLMHLSGRQTKRDRRITTSGMLAGLWVFQAALGPLTQHGPEQLNAMLENHLPLFALKR
jgi:H+/Cl- antiporter ClcA